MELDRRRQRTADGGLMARPTHVYTIEYVAMLIGENLELVQEIASNSDNIDHGEMPMPMTAAKRASRPSPTGASKA